MLKKSALIAAMAFLAFISAFTGMAAGARAEDDSVFSYAQEDAYVQMLAKGGKYNVITTLKNLGKGDFKVSRTEEGDMCLRKKDSLVFRAGESPKPGMVLVRLVAVGSNPDECPLLTPSLMSETEFKAGQRVWFERTHGARP